MAKAPSSGNPESGPRIPIGPVRCRGPRAPGKDGANSAGLRRRRRSTKSWSWCCCRRQGRIRGNALGPLTGPRKGQAARRVATAGERPGGLKRRRPEESTLGGERAGGGHSQVQQSERGKAMILDLHRLTAQSEDFCRAGNWGSIAAGCWRCKYGAFEREPRCEDCDWGYCPRCQACSPECELVQER